MPAQVKLCWLKAAAVSLFKAGVTIAQIVELGIQAAKWTHLKPFQIFPVAVHV